MPTLDEIIKEFIGSEEYITDRKITEDEIVLDVSFPRISCTCPSCGGEKQEVKDYREQKVALALCDKVPVYARIHKRRLRCYRCGRSFYQPIPFLKRNQRRSTVFLKSIAEEYAKEQSFVNVAKRFKVSTSVIRHANKMSDKNEE